MAKTTNKDIFDCLPVLFQYDSKFIVIRQDKYSFFFSYTYQGVVTKTVLEHLWQAKKVKATHTHTHTKMFTCLKVRMCLASLKKQMVHLLLPLRKK